VPGRLFPTFHPNIVIFPPFTIRKSASGVLFEELKGGLKVPNSELPDAPLVKPSVSAVIVQPNMPPAEFVEKIKLVSSAEAFMSVEEKDVNASESPMVQARRFGDDARFAAERLPASGVLNVAEAVMESVA
jgi:hypothetical protein